MTLHGIRTRGVWQKALADLLSEAELQPASIDYGYYSIARLLVPVARRHQVAWVAKEIAAIVSRYRLQEHGAPSIIAHSFGTYLVMQALRMYPEIHLRHVILAGSVLPPNFDFRPFLNTGQIASLRNEIGGRDVWTRLARYVPGDIGDSGHRGLAAGHERQTNRFLVDFGHSDFFDRDYMRREWIPLLAGQPTAPVGRMNA